MSSPTQNKEIRKLAAVMFTDIKGYTAMVQENEEVALQKVEHHRKILSQNTKENNGEVIQFYGDGSLSIYNSALEAVQCAVEMQKQYLEQEVPVRIGIHLGDIVMKNDTIYGDGVNVSSRIESQGVPGAIVVSKKMVQELVNHPQFATKSIGFFNLKNVSGKEEIFVIDHPDVYVPSRKEFKTKERINPRKPLLYWLPVLAIAIGAFLIGGKVYSNKNKAKETNKEILNQRIAVQLFDNLTNTDSLSILSNMASHWITKSLSETENAQVVSYQTVSQTQSALFKGEDLAKELGATNIIEGSIYKKADSLIISALIENIKTGVITHTFPDVKTHFSEPLEGINKLANSIKGYWTSKNENLLSPPTYDAYKAYLTAKDNWIENDVLAQKELNKAIDLDPTFLDPYFLLLDLFFYEEDSAASDAVLSTLKSRELEMSERQRNILNYHEADIAGENTRAYELYLKEYKNDPKDLFVNNSMVALGLQYVNRPDEVIEYFNEIPVENLDLMNCQYCIDRLYAGVIAYAASNQDGLSFAETLEEEANTREHLLATIKYYSKNNDTIRINRAIKKAFDSGFNNPGFTYFIAASEFALKGETQLKNTYANKTLQAYTKPSRTKGRTQLLLGDIEGAKNTFAALLNNNPNDLRNVGFYGYCLAKTDEKTEAEKILSQLESKMDSERFGDISYYKARIELALGNEGTALNLLEQSYERGRKFRPFSTFQNDPTLLPLKNNTRFKRLLKPLGT